jgi:hypothetical protein
MRKFNMMTPPNLNCIQQGTRQTMQKQNKNDAAITNHTNSTLVFGESNKNLPFSRLFLVLVLSIVLISSCAEAKELNEGSIASPGTVVDSSNPTAGYVLFAPQSSNTVYLIDKTGKVYNQWPGIYNGLNAYLLPNGNLLHTETMPNRPGSDPGGMIVMSDWNNNTLWSKTINSATHQQSHDVYPMPNGDVLAAVWEYIPATIASKKRTSCPADSGLWSGMIMQLHPSGDTAKVVWQWRFWDHLLGATDSASAYPQLLNANFIGTPMSASSDTVDWIHMNALAYNPALDQVMISSRNLNEIYIIDHSTTTAEAASHKGGKCGKGGDFLYRWGNPIAYGQNAPQQFFGQHSPYWLDTINQSATQILINNDGFVGVFHSNPCMDTSHPKATAFNIIESPYDSTTGRYGIAPNTICGPASPSWTDTVPAPAYWNEYEGNAQLLSSNNLLVCAAMNGIFYELDTTNNSVVWQYNLLNSGAFRCYQYDTSYVNPILRVYNGDKIVNRKKRK